MGSEPTLGQSAARRKVGLQKGALTAAVRDKAVIHNWIMNDCFQFPSIEADYSAAIASSVSPNPRGTAKSGRLAARFCNARPITTRLISVVPSTIRSI